MMCNARQLTFQLQLSTIWMLPSNMLRRAFTVIHLALSTLNCAGNMLKAVIVGSHAFQSTLQRVSIARRHYNEALEDLELMLMVENVSLSRKTHGLVEDIHARLGDIDSKLENITLFQSSVWSGNSLSNFHPQTAW